MPRPRKTDRPVEKNISLPTSTVARVELELFSELEGKVPFGAWQKFLVGLIDQHFARRDGANDPAVRVIARLLEVHERRSPEEARLIAREMLAAEGY